MSYPVRYCDTCEEEMTLLLENYVCDYCDGKVKDKWNEDTKPYPPPPLGIGGPGLMLDDDGESWIELADIDDPGTMNITVSTGSLQYDPLVFPF